MNIHTKRCFVRSMPKICITGNAVEAYFAAASGRNALPLLGHRTKYIHHASLDMVLAAHFCGSTCNLWMFSRCLRGNAAAHATLGCGGGCDMGAHVATINFLGAAMSHRNWSSAQL